MKVSELVDKFGLTVFSGAGQLEKDVSGGYASDLLSDVMGRMDEGMIWVTMQIHQNVVAVASLKEASAVLIVNGAIPDPETVEKGNEEGVILLGTALPSFEACGKIYGFLNE